MSLKEIRKPVKSALEEFEKHFRDSMKSKVPLLDKITYYIVKRKGKQIRPLFVFLSAKMCGDINPSTFNAASLVELVHTASLVHDDVVDDSSKRRGFFSINALWKNKIAVLVGDYLLSKGLLLALENEEFTSLKILTGAVKALSEGELLQLEKARRLDIQEDIYFEIIRQKTASLIAAACKVGAASVSKDEAIIEKAFEFGETIGIAYQIKDDLFDYGDEEIGKPRGIDIKEKKMTLPLIYALSQSSKSERRKIINIIKNKSEDKSKVREVIAFVKEKGGLEYAKDKMVHYSRRAKSILDSFPQNDASNSLGMLIDFVIDRRK